MNIVLLDASTLGGVDTAPLSAQGHLTSYPLSEKDQVLTRLQDADVVITNKVVLDENILSRLSNLKLVCVAATGTNNVDLQAARECGIAVCNVAGYSTPSVVQHTFSLMMNLIGNTHKYIADCAQGAWQASPMFCRLDHPINELAGKTLAIIGYGQLGQAVAKVAEAFGMEVLITERKGKTPRPGRVSFERALSEADIISLHCPLDDTTRNLIGAHELASLKPGSLLINTARGGIVDEQALVAALESGPLAGAAFDVLSTEPAQQDNPLVRYRGDKLLLTPHIAWASRQSIERLVAEIAANIQAFARGEQRNRVV